MTFVITEPCIGTKDTSCVDVCPVDCIHPTKNDPDFETAEMLYIDPAECIDCGACEPACPVEAIFEEDAVPEQVEGVHREERGVLRKEEVAAPGSPSELHSCVHAAFAPARRPCGWPPRRGHRPRRGRAERHRTRGLLARDARRAERRPAHRGLRRLGAPDADRGPGRSTSDAEDHVPKRTT